MTNFWTSLAVQWLGLHDSTALQERKIRSLVGDLRSKKKKKKRKRANFCTENLNSMLKYMVDTGLPLRRPTFRTESSFLQLLKELVAKSLQLGLLHPSQRSLVSQAKIKNHSILGDKLVGSIQDNSEGQPAPELPVRLAEVSVVTASCPTFPQ